MATRVVREAGLGANRLSLPQRTGLQGSCVYKREWKYYFLGILVTGPVWFRTVGLSVDQTRGEERKPTAVEERQLPTGERSGNRTRRDPPLTARATHSDWCHESAASLRAP